MHRIVASFAVAFVAVLVLMNPQKTSSDDAGKKILSFESDKDLNTIRFVDCRGSLVAQNATDGERALKVSFESATRPRVEILPAGAPWDWRGYDRIAIDVTNTAEHEAGFSIRLDDDASATDALHSVSGGTTISPHRSVSVYLPFGRNGSTERGMRGAPTLPGVEPFAHISMERLVDESHIVALRISSSGGEKPTALIFDNLRLLRPTSYERIVDAFGQYTRMDWPGKVKDPSDFARFRAAEESEIKAAPALPDRDEYGGWARGPRVEATGFFGTVNRGGKWWLVTPSGHLFLSLGIDVILISDGPTIIEKREDMFSWLPGPADPLAKFFGKVDNVLYGPTKSGRAFNFYEANLQRKYGDDYVEHWRSSALDRLRAWGFNTIGNWSDPALYALKRVPYTATIDLHGDYARVASGQDYWGKMHDPFDPRFAAAVDRSIGETVGRYRTDPWCIGYFIDNEISWGSGGDDRNHFGLVYGTLAADGSSPAKQAITQWLKKRYGGIEDLNKAWAASFASWEAFTNQPFKPEGALGARMREDFGGFLAEFARQYFRVVRDAEKRHDPNHLYLGCRFAWRTPEAVSAAAEYCDVVSFNIYRSHVDPGEWGFAGSLEKPCIIGEFHFGAVDRGMFHTGLVSTPNQKARAQMYRDYIHSVVDHPAFVGCAWFQYFDEPLTGRTYDGENYNIGFIDVSDSPYPEMVAAAKSVHAEAYARRNGLPEKPARRK